MKLLEHIKAMQAMAAHFITPEPYTDRQGDVYTNDARNSAFINDMIYMLDGPEQREAQAEAEVEASNEFNLEWRMDIRKQVEQADIIARDAQQQARILLKKLEQADADNNELRSRLMSSELAYASLRGYTDRMVDEQPPVMVPERRDSALSRMCDGSFGTQSPDWRQDGSGRAVRHWYHRS